MSKRILLALLLLCPAVWARSNAAVRAYNEGVVLFNQKNFSAATAQFDDAISNDSNFAEAYYARGACKHYMKSEDSALLDLNEALRQKPDFLEARALRGAVAYETDRWDSAMDDFSAVLAQKPQDAQSLLGRGVIHLKRDHPDEAARDFRGFLKVRPDDPISDKVRQILASLNRVTEEAKEAPRAPGGSPASRRTASAEMKKIADSFMNHPLTDSHTRKALRGENAQAVGDIHSAPGFEIVDPH